MKRVALLFLSFFCFLSLMPSYKANAQEIDDFFGYYELNRQDSILKGFEIQKNMFGVIIDNENIFNGEEDIYVEFLLNWRNHYTNEDALALLEDDEIPQNNNSGTYPALNINFSDRGVFPTFQLEVINPDYELEGNQLTIRYKDDTLYTFEILEDGKISDKLGNQFTLIE